MYNISVDYTVSLLFLFSFFTLTTQANLWQHQTEAGEIQNEKHGEMKLTGVARNPRLHVCLLIPCP